MVIMLEYISVNYEISFDEPIHWNICPSIVFRSVLGMQLHALCCVLKDQPSCNSCPVSNTCVYAWFFETHISKDSPSLEGRDRAPHPFVMEYTDIDGAHGSLLITYMGRGSNFIPYVEEALRRAGEHGVTRDRVPYVIDAISCKGVPFVYDFQSIKGMSRIWPIENVPDCTTPLCIKFITPLRIKKDSKYQDSIDLGMLLHAIQRRILTLESLYGNNPAECVLEDIPKNNVVGQEWVELPYYSSRQHSLMQLGGVKGGIEVQGSVPGKLMGLLMAGEVFHVGKNVSFGLGQIRIGKGGYVNDIEQKTTV